MPNPSDSLACTASQLTSNFYLNTISTGAEVDWNLIDSDHAGVKLWLDVRKISQDPALSEI